MQQATTILLSELQPSESCTVVSFSNQDQLSTRLLTMGLFPGIRLRVVRNAPFLDPMEIEVDGAFVCLRRHESHLIKVTRL